MLALELMLKRQVGVCAPSGLERTRGECGSTSTSLGCLTVVDNFYNGWVIQLTVIGCEEGRSDSRPLISCICRVCTAFIFSLLCSIPTGTTWVPPSGLPVATMRVKEGNSDDRVLDMDNDILVVTTVEISSDLSVEVKNALRGCYLVVLDDCLLERGITVTTKLSAELEAPMALACMSKAERMDECILRVVVGRTACVASPSVLLLCYGCGLRIHAGTFPPILPMPYHFVS